MDKGTVKKNGKKEEKINVAKKLLKMKMTVEQVEEATGLTKKNRRNKERYIIMYNK